VDKKKSRRSKTIKLAATPKISAENLARIGTEENLVTIEADDQYF